MLHGIMVMIFICTLLIKNTDVLIKVIWQISTKKTKFELHERLMATDKSLC